MYSFCILSVATKLFVATESELSMATIFVAIENGLSVATFSSSLKVIFFVVLNFQQVLEKAFLTQFTPSWVLAISITSFLVE